MANQQSLSVNDYVFAKPRPTDGRGKKRGGGLGGLGDRGRKKFSKPPLFDGFRRPLIPQARSPFHRGGGASSIIPNLGLPHAPPRLRPPLQPPPHQRGVGPGPPNSMSQQQQQQQQQQSSAIFSQFSKGMMIPSRPNMMQPPSTASSSFPPSSSFPSFPGAPPTGPPPSGPPPSGPPPPFGSGVFAPPPSRGFYHPYFKNVRPHLLMGEGHYAQGKQQFHDFHQSKRGHHQSHHQGPRAKCKKNYRPYNRPRFCKNRGRGAPGLLRAMGQRSKAPSNSALTTSFIMSDYYRQEAVASPDLRGHLGSKGIPDPVSIPICCCENDSKQDCDACLNLVSFDEDHDSFHDPDMELTDEDCDCPDCFEDAAATYDFMKCDFEQVFSEQQDSKEATAEADKFS